MSISTTVTQSVTDMLGAVQRQADRIVIPESRQQVLDRIYAFACERPMLSGFIVLNAILTVPPILLFVTFCISTLLLSLCAAVAVALFWTCAAAFFILVPVLLAGTATSCIAWVWGASAFFIVRWLGQVMGVDVVNKGGEIWDGMVTQGRDMIGTNASNNGITGNRNLDLLQTKKIRLINGIKSEDMDSHIKIDTTGTHVM